VVCSVFPCVHAQVKARLTPNEQQLSSFPPLPNKDNLSQHHTLPFTFLFFFLFSFLLFTSHLHWSRQKHWKTRAIQHKMTPYLSFCIAVLARSTRLAPNEKPTPNTHANLAPNEIKKKTNNDCLSLRSPNAVLVFSFCETIHRVALFLFARRSALQAM